MSPKAETQCSDSHQGWQMLCRSLDSVWILLVQAQLDREVAELKTCPKVSFAKRQEGLGALGCCSGGQEEAKQWRSSGGADLQIV